MLKRRLLMLNSMFFIKAAVRTEFDVTFKGYKLDSSEFKDCDSFEDVKIKFCNDPKNENKEIRFISETTEKRKEIIDKKEQDIEVKKIKLEIIEKSNVELIESEFFNDGLSKYLSTKITHNSSYNELIEILQNYKDEEGKPNPIEFNKETNGIVKIAIYNDKRLVNVNETNKDNVLNFTRIHFIFTQDLYKECPVKISMNLSGDPQKYELNKYNVLLCEKNGTTIKDLFYNITVGEVSKYDVENYKIKEVEKVSIKEDYDLYRFINSPFNINTINTFRTIKKVKFKYKYSGKEEIIYDEATGNIENFFNEKFRYFHLGEYIIETDLSYNNHFYINVNFNYKNTAAGMNFHFNKNITVSEFKEFLKNNNIISDNDSFKMFCKKKCLNDSDIIGGSDKFYSCEVILSDFQEFSNREVFKGLKMGDFFNANKFNSRIGYSSSVGMRKKK